MFKIHQEKVSINYQFKAKKDNNDNKKNMKQIITIVINKNLKGV